MNISLEELLRGLVSRGTSKFLSKEIETGTSAPTSIRLKPSTKAFIECQAQSLNTSVQSVISIILDGVAEATTNKVQRALSSIRERFFYIFSAHGISLPQTAEILRDHGFTLSTFESPSRLLDLLNPRTINFVANTFFVEPGWISGSHDRITNVAYFNWYKNTHAAIRRVLDYHLRGLRPHVIFIRRSGADFNRARQDDDRGLVDKEPVGISVRLNHTSADGSSYYTYDTWAFERWNYHNCRFQLKLFIAACTEICSLLSASRVSYAGHSLEDSDLEALVMGNTLPAAVLNRLGQVTWYPDDYADTRGEVSAEIEDWMSVKKEYESSKYSEFIKQVLDGKAPH